MQQRLRDVNVSEGSVGWVEDRCNGLGGWWVVFHSEGNLLWGNHQSLNDGTIGFGSHSVPLLWESDGADCVCAEGRGGGGMGLWSVVDAASPDSSPGLDVSAV